MDEVLETERVALCGERYEHLADRHALRAGLSEQPKKANNQSFGSAPRPSYLVVEDNDVAESIGVLLASA